MESNVHYSRIVKAAYFILGGLCLVAGSIQFLSLWVDLPLMTRFFSKVSFVCGVVGMVGVYASWNLLGKERTHNLVLSTLLLLVTVTLMIGFGEVIVRYALRDITTTQYSASYFSTRWAESHVERNSLGFREKEVSAQKPNDLYRITVIGDSFTFGQGIPAEKRFSNLIHDKLQKGDSKFEVVNFGWVGVDTVRETRFLSMILEKYHPDYVLLQWFVNDVVDDEHLKRIPKRWRLSPSWTLHRYLNYHSGLYYLLNEQLHAIQMNMGLAKKYDDYYRQSWKNSESHESLKYKEAVRVFIQKCRTAQVPVGIVLFPKLLPELDNAYPYGYVHDLVLDVCRNEGVTCLDLRDSLARYSRSDDRRVFHVNQFDTHPSEFVNQIAAEKIFEVFSALWMSEAAQGRLH